MDSNVDITLVLSFEPQAIRDHFDGSMDDDEVANWILNADDATLKSMAEGCLSSDILYRTFHEVMVLEAESMMEKGKHG